MRILPLACVISLALPLRAKDLPAPPEFYPVREFIQQAITNHRTPSLAVAVMQSNKLVWAEGFGVAELDAKRAASADALYLLASVSKPIAATGLMLLVERGKVHLDWPANHFLPKAKLRAHAGNADDITVRRLLNHTSGIGLHYNFYYDTAPPPRDETITRYGFAYNPPGTRYEYCNLGFGIVDHITSLQSRESWTRFMEKELFDRAGMKSTGGRVRPGLEKQASAQYTTDAGGRFTRIAPYGFDHDGASAVWSTANDLAKFARMHLGGGVVDFRTVLKAETVAAMQVPGTATLTNAPDPGYGLGWFIGRANGHRAVWHTGGMPGVSTIVRLYPDRDAALVVLCNSDVRGLVADTERRLAQTILGPASANPIAAAAGALGAGVRSAATSTTNSFAGNWEGKLAHFEGDIPLRLEVGTNGVVRAKLGTRDFAQLDRVAFRQGKLHGETEGFLKTQPGYHGPVNLEFRLERGGERLTGVCVASARGYFALSHYVELQKVK